MTTPERALIRRRLRVLDDEPHAEHTPGVLESEDAWVKNFVRRLSFILHSIGRKKSS
jgi:hypothetical protein